MSEVCCELHPGLRPASRADQLRAKWHDGTLLIGAGVFLLGAVLAETIRWLVGADGRITIFPVFAVLGVGALGYGSHQQRMSVRRARTAVVVGVWDPGGPAGGEGRIKRAVAYCRSRHELTLQVRAELTSGPADRALMDQVVAQTSKAIEQADRFKARPAERVDLLPVMRLHLSFWLGAMIGREPVAPVALWQPSRDEDGYYLATVLPPVDPSPSHGHQAGPPPFVVNVESLGADAAARAALAVSGWHRDAASEERIRAKSRSIGVGQLLWLRSTSDWVDPDAETVAAALRQVEREWSSRLPAAAATYAVFLDTTATVAIGIGTRLARTEPERWTAYTRDRTGLDGFVQFPPAEGGS